MHSFAQLTGTSFKMIFLPINSRILSFFFPDFPTIQFSPLLVSVIIIVASTIGLVTGISIDYIVGISLDVVSILISLTFLLFIRYLLRHKDYMWTANVARFIRKRLEMLRFLLEVLFMNPYAHHCSNANDTIDYRKMK